MNRGWSPMLALVGMGVVVLIGLGAWLTGVAPDAPALGLVVGAPVACWAGVTLWSLPNGRRARLLARQRPAALVARSSGTPSLFVAADELAAITSTEIPPPVFGISMVADDRGIELWTGWIHPQLWLRAPWPVVRDVELDDPALGQLTGIAVSVVVAGRTVRLPIPLMRSGVAALWSLSRADREGILEHLRRLREPTAVA